MVWNILEILVGAALFAAWVAAALWAFLAGYDARFKETKSNARSLASGAGYALGVVFVGFAIIYKASGY